MPVEMNGQPYYRTAEVYRTLGISRNTLYRWLQKGILGTTEHRDIRGWRLFTTDDIDTLRQLINRIVEIERVKGRKMTPVISMYFDMSF